MRTKIYHWLAQTVTQHNKKVLMVCALLTIALIIASGRLGMRNQFADMMPQDIPQVEEFNQIIEDYSSASTVMIAVESENKDLAAMQKAAEAIAARLKNQLRITPRKDQKRSLSQRIALMGKKHPVPGVIYDTLQLVKRIDYKIDNDFISDHGMMMQKPKDLESTMEMFGSIALPELLENINNNFEKEFVDDQENLTTLDGESEAVQGLEGVYKFVRSISDYIDKEDPEQTALAVKEFVTGPEYFISSDNTLLLVMLQPTVDWNNFEAGMDLGYRVVDSLNTIQKAHPDVKIGASGWMILQIDETEALKKDFGWPSLFALLLILVMLIGSFRTWKNPFFSVVVLVIGIIWVTGILALVLHYLNMMSASFGIVLIGLGIDFGIHFISGFRDGREQGKSVPDSILYMYEKAGNGVVTGGLTTAIVFYTLAATNFKALTEMGIAVGTGIIVLLLAMMVLLPALIVWDHKGYSVVGNFLRKLHLGFLAQIFSAVIGFIYAFFNLKLFSHVTDFLQFRFLEKSGRLVNKLPVSLIIILISAVTVYISWEAGKTIQFEYDMMELEPIGIPSVIVQDKILERFEISPDYALMKADNEEDCREKLRQLKKAGNRSGIIGGVDGITEFIPIMKHQKENRRNLEQFRTQLQASPLPRVFDESDLDKLVEELERLHQNVVEIGELSIMGSGESNKILRKCDQISGKKDEGSKLLAIAEKLKNTENVAVKLAAFQSLMAGILKEKLLKMSSTETITLENLPESITERYVNPKNDDLLITIFPKSNIWEETTLRRFHEITSKISEKITGTPAITLLFIDLTKVKGRMALLYGAMAILFFLMLDFRSLRYPLLAAIPLFVGSIWMVGFMALFGIKFNYSNFMALPLIIGIGIDDGVHILHRYKLEGRNSIPTVIHFTGRAILLTSLTTMIGFGSMGLASHRGVASMGQVLFLGVGCCFLSSAYLLPAIITVFEKIFKNGKKEVQHD